MTTVRESIDVDVAVQTAYDQWTQFESFPQFMEGVEAVQQLDARTLHWVTKVAGVRREFDTEIIEQVPDQRIAWRSTGGDVSHAGAVSFDSQGPDKTRVTVEMDWQPEGVAEKVADAAGVDNRQVRADTLRFKEFIEGRGVETGGWRGTIQ